MQVKLLALQPGEIDKSWLVEYAARVCYRSALSVTDAARLAFLDKLRHATPPHLSVFEHARFIEFDYVRRDLRPDEQSTPHAAYYLHSYNARHAIESAPSADLFDVFNRAPQIPYGGLTPAQRLTHAAATFEIGGISRTCSHQLVRHRALSFSQESQRHCPPDGDWIIPPTIEANDDALYAYMDALAVIEDAAERLRALGIPQEDVRLLYAQAAPTRLVVTGRFAAWQHFLALRTVDTGRTAHDPQWEIRNVALEIARLLRAADPEVFPCAA